jgi:hypothetical protein
MTEQIIIYAILILALSYLGYRYLWPKSRKKNKKPPHCDKCG